MKITLRAAIFLLCAGILAAQVPTILPNSPATEDQEFQKNVLLRGTANYLNFGTTFGTTGYGLRNNSGTIQLKNSGGAWSNILTAASAAPIDAAYLTATANGSLTAEVNLGALTTGLLKGTVAAGVSTISSITDSSANWDAGYTYRVTSVTATGLTLSSNTISLTTGYMIPGAGSAGQILTSAGASAPAWTTATFPATATTTGAYLRADGTNWITSTLVLPNAGTAYKLPVYSATNTITELAAVGATGEYLAGSTGAVPLWATLNQAAVAGLTTGSSPVFVTVKLSGLTDGYVPYHVADATGLANSPIYTDGTNVGIGTASPEELVELRKTSSGANVALKVVNVSTDASSSASIILGSSASSGNSYFTHNTNTGVLTILNEHWPFLTNTIQFQIRNVSAGFATPMTMLSTGNIGIGITAPSYQLSVSDGTDQLGLYHDGTDAYFKTTDGSFIFQTDEGTNTTTYLDVKPKGSATGRVRAYDENSTNYMQSYCASGAGYIDTVGAGAGALYLQNGTAQNIYCWPSISSGNPEFRVYGWDAGAAAVKYGRLFVDASGGANFVAQAGENVSVMSTGAGSTLLFSGSGTTNFYGNSDYVSHFLDGSHYYIQWSDGALKLSTDEGTNTPTYVEIKPKGTSEISSLALYDTDAKELEIYTAAGASYLAGTTGLTVYGSTADNGDLTLEGTSSGTKTSSYIILQPTAGNVGIGTTTPGYLLEVDGTFEADSINVNGAYTFPTADGSANYYLKTNGSGTSSWASIPAGLVYKGTVDGDDGKYNGGGTALIDGTGSAGDFYRCTDAGTYDYGNPNGNSITLALGDDLFYNGANWQKIAGVGYTLQAATDSVLGGIKVGTSLAIASEILNIADGDKGDITVATSGTVWTIDTSAVTYAKIQNVSAQWKLLGRKSAGAGAVEEFDATGTGDVVLATSPTLVTPTLGVAAATSITLTGLANFDPPDYAGAPVNGDTNALFNFSDSVADDGSVTLPDQDTHAFGVVMVSTDGGAMAEYAQFIVDNDGDVTVLSKSTNVVNNADTDGNVCIGTAAAQTNLLIKNRLGATRRVSVHYWYY